MAIRPQNLAGLAPWAPRLSPGCDFHDMLRIKMKRAKLEDHSVASSAVGDEPSAPAADQRDLQLTRKRLFNMLSKPQPGRQGQ